VWEKDGRFYDPFRPNIEPDGFASAEEMENSRQACIRAFREGVDSGRGQDCIIRSAALIFLHLQKRCGHFWATV
jgi:hypothetical protein